MKTTLTFNLSDENDRFEYDTALDAPQLSRAVTSLKDELRRMLKYQEHGEDVRAVLEQLRQTLYEQLEGCRGQY
jgi:hypothetical protein